ncbi:MAG: sugar porter family MFS transporter [Candidatus Thermoplasmatota archaeon]|jgi:putative MFS transporter|nr:sugar porter family MFS transporter [Candidatus Thermoplasmatota archaeon]MCL5988391.1 sugar porter family MFS transporter [Candidatus Thermoplasmatota archaeon]
MFNELDESRLKSIHLKITALSSAGNFLDGYDIAIISVAILLLKNEYSLSSLDQTLLLGSTIIGMIFGGILGGIITDLKGRKYIYMWDMLLFILFTFLTAISQSFNELLIFRLLLGIAIGADYAISPTIIAEYSPSRLRGRLLTVNGVAWFVGAALSYGAGFMLAPYGSIGWRVMFLLGIIPAALVLFLRSSISESPRWLAEKGRIEEAVSSAEKVVGSVGEVNTARGRKSGFKLLFAAEYRKSTIFVLSFWFILDAVSYAIALNGPTFISNTYNLTSGDASLISAMIALVAIVGAVMAFFVIDTTGRRKVTIYGFIGMALTLFAASISVMLSMGILPVIFLIILFEISEEFGPGITNSIYPQELFPTGVRATAQGLGTTVSRIGALVGIFAFTLAADLLNGFAYALIMLALLSVAGIIISIAYGPETSGLSLEQASGEINPSPQ